MAKKKSTANEKQFIAFDNYTELVIGRGSRNQVLDLIEMHVEEEGYDEKDVTENIHVFELGEEMTVNAFPKGLEITIES
jgi:hypothetical protein